MGSDSFFNRFLFAYAPLFGSHTEQKQELRKIISRLKKNDSTLIDPVHLKLKPMFNNLITELFSIANRLKNLYAGN